jgi:hypothetical protein
MTWAKVDDRLHGHAKAARAGEALSLWVLALSWCAAYLTDGEVPREQPARLIGAKGPKFAARLVEAGLWETTESGYKFHDWHDYQPSGDEVRASRAEAKTRMQRIRGVGENVRANKTRTDGEQNANFARSSQTVRDSFATPVPVPVPVPREDLPSVGPRAPEALALPTVEAKPVERKAKAAPAPDAPPPEGTLARRVFDVLSTDSAFDGLVRPGDLAARVCAEGAYPGVDVLAEVRRAGAWAAGQRRRPWRDVRAGLLGWLRRAAEDAQQRPQAGRVARPAVGPTLPPFPTPPKREPMPLATIVELRRQYAQSLLGPVEDEAATTPAPTSAGGKP